MSPRRRLFRVIGTLRSLLPRRFGVVLLGARPAQDAADGVVALMARVLEHLIPIVARERDRDLPWARVDLWILDDDFVRNRAGVDAREALDEAQRVAVRHAPHP